MSVLEIIRTKLQKQAALKAAQIAAVRSEQQCCYRGVNYCR